MDIGTYLAENVVTISVSSFITISILSWLLSKALPRGYIFTFLGVAITPAVSMLGAMLATAGILILFGGPSTIQALASADGIIFLMETTIEFGFLGVVMGLLTFPTIRYISRSERSA